MIWVAGRLVPDDALSISVLDRTFEHGLGLFETLRTWNRRASLLDRHLARMTRSAERFGLPIDRGALPDAAAVARLLDESAIDGDAVLRITLSGGLSESGGSTIWLRARPLPPRRDKPGITLDVDSWRVERGDLLARHKTLNYWQRRLAYDDGQARGADEVASTTEDGCVWEGSRTNLFLVADGRLITPPLEGPIVPGIMRGLVLERADAAGMSIEIREIERDEIGAADEVFITNSVRGLIPVAEAADATWVPPWPVFGRLDALVSGWLREGGRP